MECNKDNIKSKFINSAVSTKFEVGAIVLALMVIAGATDSLIEKWQEQDPQMRDANTTIIQQQSGLQRS